MDVVDRRGIRKSYEVVVVVVIRQRFGELHRKIFLVINGEGDGKITELFGAGCLVALDETVIQRDLDFLLFDAGCVQIHLDSITTIKRDVR